MIEGGKLWTILVMASQKADNPSHTLKLSRKFSKKKRETPEAQQWNVLTKFNVYGCKEQANTFSYLPHGL